MSITQEQIIEVFEKYDYPISAAWIAKQLSVDDAENPTTKKQVNSLLYKMKKEDVVETVEMSPMLWRVISF